ncbi:hypothetical protein [Cryobacterium lactosi]|uniref:hypothetical protein n=1 Tax=Cryobacterium lactosi TaxID=1259202 RepID=UPI0030BA2607
MEHEIKRERVLDSIDKHHKTLKSLGGRPHITANIQIPSTYRVIEAGDPTAQGAPDFKKVPSYVLPSGRLAGIDAGSVP